MEAIKVNLQEIDKWHHTKLGHLAFGAVELLASYFFASLAIDRGSLVEYAITIILFIGAIQNFVRIFKLPNNESKHR
jgi:hypothetical protein